jgi:hypothetical protein
VIILAETEPFIILQKMQSIPLFQYTIINNILINKREIIILISVAIRI